MEAEYLVNSQDIENKVKNDFGWVGFYGISTMVG